MRKVLAIIPARGNSKGIKKKNIQLVNKKPLIYYTIKEAKKSKLISNLILSSEDNKIRKIANKFGCETPFRRPKILSKDDTKTYEVIKHAFEFMEKKNRINYDYILLLQPTCPLRKLKDIDFAINFLLKNKKRYDSVVSVVDVGANHPYRMKIIKKNYLKNFFEQGFEDMRPRQKLPKVYIRNGSIYLIKRAEFIKYKSLVGKKTFPYIMEQKNSINIDTIDDLELFKKKFKK